MRAHWLAGLALAFSLTACGDDDASEGTLKVTAYGESFIEDGIPADAMSDGWAVSFERFEVAITGVRVAGLAVPVAPSVDVAEASNEAGHEIGSTLVPAGDHDDGAFTIDRMEVVGTASKGAESKSFDWVFDEPVAYDGCESVTSIARGGEATFQITVHADHLFYDSLVALSPQVVFQALADADANEDGEIVRAELAAASIGAYDPGSAGGIEDLWAWLNAAAATVGHVDGEGHCELAAD